MFSRIIGHLGSAMIRCLPSAPTLLLFLSPFLCSCFLENSRSFRRTLFRQTLLFCPPFFFAAKHVLPLLSLVKMEGPAPP